MTRVVAALIERNSRILICQRKGDAAFPLKWEFPGGKVERNETPEIALARELAEELGVQASIGRGIYRTTYQYPGHEEPIELTFYVARIEVQTASNPEHAFEQVIWVTLEDLPKYEFLAANADLILQLADGSISLA